MLHSLRGYNWMYFAIGILYCYLEFKLRYPKNLKLFFSKIIIRRKGNRCLLFLKLFSWETDLWVMIGNLTLKKRKIRKGNLYFTKNQSVRNEIRCAEDGHSYMSKMCAKEFSDFKLIIKQLLAKYWFFKELPQISYTHKKCNFLSITGLF